MQFEGKKPSFFRSSFFVITTSAENTGLPSSLWRFIGNRSITDRVCQPQAFLIPTKPDVVVKTERKRDHLQVAPAIETGFAED